MPNKYIDFLPSLSYIANTRLDTPFDTPLPSGATTPRLLEPDTKKKRKKDGKSRATSPRKVAVTCDEEIEPDELVPQYLDTRTKLYALQRPLLDAPKGKQKKLVVENGQSSSDELEIAKLQAKIAKIELDVLFEKDVATAQWREKKIILEREYSAAKKIKDEEAKAQAASQEPEPAVAQSAEDEIAREAEKMAAEILAENDNEEDALAGLFDSLPTNEVDPLTGKSSTVMTGADGVKLTIHDFGKWTGISPSRALDEICRGRFVVELVLHDVFNLGFELTTHQLGIPASRFPTRLFQPQLSPTNI